MARDGRLFTWTLTRSIASGYQQFAMLRLEEPPEERALILVLNSFVELMERVPN